MLMSAFPPADHWHVATSRLGPWQTFPERHDRAAAIQKVRDLLVSDGQATGDHRYVEAITAIDSGYGSYWIDSRYYVAFPCACPQLPKEKGKDGVIEVPHVFTLRSAEPERLR
ncbi:hypothetical protein ACQP1W_47320 [Spirillospora sp. CA-255316]